MTRNWLLRHPGRLFPIIATLCLAMFSQIDPPTRETDIMDSSGLHQSGSKARAHFLRNYERLPLTFEPNEGQVNGKFDFIARANAYDVYLSPTEAILTLQGNALHDAPKRGASELSSTQTGNMVHVKLVGANPHSLPVETDELPGKTNYFIGNNPERWRTGIRNFAKVKYHEVYPGTDLIYYGNHNHLEFDMIAKPGADPSKISIQIQGADDLLLDGAGDILLKTRGGEIRFHKPLVYQSDPDAAGSKKLVDGRYVLRGSREIAFEIGAYDHERPITIDPVISYSTYLGGSGWDVPGRSIRLDAAGNVYIAGGTQSGNLASTPGALQPAFGGYTGLCMGSPCGDAFVAKLRPDGSALLYLTYLGGSGGEYGSNFAVTVHPP